MASFLGPLGITVNPTSKVAFTAKAKRGAQLELADGKQLFAQVSTQDSGLIVVTALAFVITGGRLIRRHPVIQKFLKAHDTWKKLRINSAPIGSDLSLADLGQWRFEEISNKSNDAHVIEQVKNKRFGTVVTLVCYKERQLHQLARELSTYSAIFLLLLVVGILLNLNEVADKPLLSIVQKILSYHTIPILELLSLAYLLVRFFIEMQSIKYLLEEE